MKFKSIIKAATKPFCIFTALTANVCLIFWSIDGYKYFYTVAYNGEYDDHRWLQDYDANSHASNPTYVGDNEGKSFNPVPVGQNIVFGAMQSAVGIAATYGAYHIPTAKKFPQKLRNAVITWMGSGVQALYVVGLPCLAHHIGQIDGHKDGYRGDDFNWLNMAFQFGVGSALILTEVMLPYFAPKIVAKLEKSILRDNYYRLKPAEEEQTQATVVDLDDQQLDVQQQDSIEDKNSTEHVVNIQVDNEIDESRMYCPISLDIMKNPSYIEVKSGNEMSRFYYDYEEFKKHEQSCIAYVETGNDDNDMDYRKQVQIPTTNQPIYELMIHDDSELKNHIENFRKKLRADHPDWFCPLSGILMTNPVFFVARDDKKYYMDYDMYLIKSQPTRYILKTEEVEHPIAKEIIAQEDLLSDVHMKNQIKSMIEEKEKEHGKSFRCNLSKKLMKDPVYIIDKTLNESGQMVPVTCYFDKTVLKRKIDKEWREHKLQASNPVTTIDKNGKKKRTVLYKAYLKEHFFKDPELKAEIEQRYPHQFASKSRSCAIL